jgi:hypothetical protein
MKQAEYIVEALKRCGVEAEIFSTPRLRSTLRRFNPLTLQPFTS